MLTDSDKGWIRNAFHELHGGNPVGRFIREWGSPAVLVGLVIFVLAEWSAYVEFRTRTADRLDTIEKKLTSAELKDQATKPQTDFNKSLSEVKATIATARKDNINIDPKVIDELSKKLLATSSDAPDFWPTLSEFISYRSLVTYQGPVQLGKPEWGKTFRLEKIPDCTDSLPEPMTVKEVLSPQQAVLSRGVYKNCRFVLDSEAQNKALNAILKSSTPEVTFQNCLVEYHGGEINLILAWDKEPLTWRLVGRGPQDPDKIIHTTLSGPAIQFENCLFIFTFQNAPPPNGQRLATALLAQNTESISLPISP